MVSNGTVEWLIAGLLFCILIALVVPKLFRWWATRRYLKLVERQERFLKDYDVFSVSPGDHERLLMGLYASDDPKALLLTRKGIESAKLLYPTKAKTDADKKSIFDKEEDRRQRLGFPSQTVRRDYKAEYRYYRPHYEHLKSGVKVETCWLCDQNDAEADERHRDIWSKHESEEAEEIAKNSRIDAMFEMGKIPPPATIRCEDAELLYARLKSKNNELRANISETDWKGRTAVTEGFSVIMGRINAARACGKFGPCTIHVPRS